MIRILFTKAPGIVAAAIRFVTRSPVTHVGIQVGDDDVLQADQGGVKRGSMKDFLVGGRQIVAAMQVIESVESRLTLDYTLSQLGDQYDYEGMVGDFIPMMALLWFKVKMRNPFAHPHEYWCSEYGMTIDQKHIIPEWKDLEPTTVTPGQLLAACRSGSPLGSFFEVNPSRR